MASTELVVLENLNPIEIFTPQGTEDILERITREAKSVVLDISTKDGRDTVRSLASKIAKSKTYLDGLGKDLVSGWKKQAEAVDAERKRIRDTLDALKEEVRKPLTDWEEAEKSRVAKHEADIAEIINGGTFMLQNWQTLPPQAMADRLKEIEAMTCWTWQEFAARAKQAIEESTAKIREAIQKREAYDAEQAELERLRREEAEWKQREHEARIAAEAAAKAKAEAEEKARKDAEAEAARVKAEQEKAERERQRIERERAEAEERARKAEEARIAAEEKAKADAQAAAEKARQDAIAAAEQAKRDAEAAAQRERDKIEAERKAEAEAAAKREADKKHRAKVNSEALVAILATGITEEQGKAIIAAIAKGEIPHVKIQY